MKRTKERVNVGKIMESRVKATCKRCKEEANCQEDLVYTKKVKGKDVLFGLCDDCIVDGIMDRK